MRLLAIPLLCLVLPGCALTGSKTVNGSFACQVAEGTCAPTLTIDDRAIKKMREQAKTGNAVVYPGSVSILEGGQGRPAKIVFPAYFDAQGRLHEQTVVHTRFNDGLAVPADAAPVAAASQSSKIDLVSYAAGSGPAPSYSVAPEPPKQSPKQPVVAPSAQPAPEVFSAPGDE